MRRQVGVAAGGRVSGVGAVLHALHAKRTCTGFWATFRPWAGMGSGVRL